MNRDANEIMKNDAEESITNAISTYLDYVENRRAFFYDIKCKTTIILKIALDNCKKYHTKL